ncbi:MAG: phage holin family protein [Gammaproteobacteria bacterium]|nr:phage holin family protein [Gammaproteobacteria bacterium]
MPPGVVQPLREPRRPTEQRSMAQVLADVASNLQDILSSEIRLAQAEARAQLRTFRSAGALLLIGALAGLLSAFFLLQAVVAALSLIVSVWLAALIVALVMAVVCALVLHAGARHIRSEAAKIAATAAGVKEQGP